VAGEHFISKVERVKAETFSQFVWNEYLKSEFRPNRKTYWDYMGGPLVTDVLRFETLNEDYRAFCAKFGYVVQDLPVVNKTQSRTPLSEMYDDDLRGRIGEMYAKFKGQEEGRLFGTVYKVDPVSTASVHRYPQDLYGESAAAGEQFEYHRDPVGMEVKGTASFPATYDPHEGENATQRRQRLLETAAETVIKHMQ
jgi:hypothetical protein